VGVAIEWENDSSEEADDCSKQGTVNLIENGEGVQLSDVEPDDADIDGATVHLAKNEEHCKYEPILKFQ